MDVSKIKMFFCKHHYVRHQCLSPLGKFTEQKREAMPGEYVLGLPIYCNYVYYETLEVCSKCGYEKREIKKYIAKNHKASVLR